MNFDINENDALNTMAKQAVKQAVKAEKDRTERLTKDDKDAFLKQFKEFWDFERDFHPEYKKLWGDKTEFDKADTKIINLIIGNAARDLGLDWDWIGDETYLFGFYEKNGSSKNMVVKVPYDFTFPSLRTKLLNWFRKKCEKALAAEPKKPQIKVTEAFKAGNRARKKESVQDTAAQDMMAWPCMPSFGPYTPIEEVKAGVNEYVDGIGEEFGRVKTTLATEMSAFGFRDRVWRLMSFAKPGRIDRFIISMEYVNTRDNGWRPGIAVKLSEDFDYFTEWSAPAGYSAEDAARVCTEILFNIIMAKGRINTASDVVNDEERSWRMYQLDNTFRQKYYRRYTGFSSKIIAAKFGSVFPIHVAIAFLDDILPQECVLRLDKIVSGITDSIDDNLIDMIKSELLPMEYINEAFKAGNRARKKESVQNTAGDNISGFPPVTDEMRQGSGYAFSEWFRIACPDAQKIYTSFAGSGTMHLDISRIAKDDRMSMTVIVRRSFRKMENDDWFVDKIMLRIDNGRRPSRGGAFLVKPADYENTSLWEMPMEDACALAAIAFARFTQDLYEESARIWGQIHDSNWLIDKVSQIVRLKYALKPRQVPKTFIPWTFAMEYVLDRRGGEYYRVFTTPEMMGRLIDDTGNWSVRVENAWPGLRKEIIPLLQEKGVIDDTVNEAFKAGNKARKKESVQDTAEGIELPSITPKDGESLEAASMRLENEFPEAVEQITKGEYPITPFTWGFGTSFSIGKKAENAIFIKYIFNPSDHDEIRYADLSINLTDKGLVGLMIDIPANDRIWMNKAVYDLIIMLVPYLNPESAEIKGVLTPEADEFCKEAANLMEAENNFWKTFNKKCSHYTALRTILLKDRLNSNLPESFKGSDGFHINDMADHVIHGIIKGYKDGMSPEEAVRWVRESMQRPLHDAFKAGNRARKKESVQDTAGDNFGEVGFPEELVLTFDEFKSPGFPYQPRINEFRDDIIEWVNKTYGDRLKASPKFPGSDLTNITLWNDRDRVDFTVKVNAAKEMIYLDLFRYEHDCHVNSEVCKWCLLSAGMMPCDSEGWYIYGNIRDQIDSIVRLALALTDPEFSARINAIPDFIHNNGKFRKELIRTVEGCHKDNKCGTRPEDFGDREKGLTTIALGPVMDTVISDVTVEHGFDIVIEHHWHIQDHRDAVRDLLRNTPGFPGYNDNVSEAFKAGNRARKHEKAEDTVEGMITPEMYYPPVETYNPVTVVTNLQRSLKQFTDGEVRISVDDERCCRAWIPYTDGFTDIEVLFLNEPENSGSPWCCRIRIKSTERLGYRGTVTFINDRLWDSCDSGDVPDDAGRICGDFLVYLLSRKDFTLTLIQNAINYLLNNRILDCPDPFVMATVIAGWERITPPGWRIENLHYLTGYKYADRCRALSGEETGVNEAWRAQRKAIKELPQDYIDEARVKQNMNAAVDRLAEDLWKDVTIELDVPENDKNPDPDAEPVTIVKRKVNIPELFERIKDGLNEFGDFDVDPELRPDVVGEYAVITAGGMPYAQVGGSCGIPAHMLGQYEATSLVIFKDLVYEFAKTLTNDDPGKMQEFIKALNTKADDLFW